MPFFICEGLKVLCLQLIQLPLAFFFFLFVCVSVSEACESSWAWDGTCATAVPQAAAVTMLDP